MHKDPSRLLKDDLLQRNQKLTAYNNLYNLPPASVNYMITDKVVGKDLNSCQKILTGLFDEAKNEETKAGMKS